MQCRYCFSYLENFDENYNIPLVPQIHSLQYQDILPIVIFDSFDQAHLLPKTDAVVGVIGVELFLSYCSDSFMQSSL